MSEALKVGDEVMVRAKVVDIDADEPCIQIHAGKSRMTGTTWVPTSSVTKDAAPDLLAALKPVLKEVKDGPGGEVTLGDRSSWNPDAHIEITLSASEIWAIQDAIAKATGSPSSVRALAGVDDDRR